MKVKGWLIASVIATGIGLTAGTAQAAAVNTSVAGLKPAADEATSVTKVHHHWRHHCRWRYGHWRCWWSPYRYGYYSYRPYYGYRPYYRPGFSLYIGPRYRYWY